MSDYELQNNDDLAGLKIVLPIVVALILLLMAVAYFKTQKSKKAVASSSEKDEATVVDKDVEAIESTSE